MSALPYMGQQLNHGKCRFPLPEFKWQGAVGRSLCNWTKHQLSCVKRKVAVYLPPTSTRPFYSTPSHNIKAAAPGSVSVYTFNFFFASPRSFPSLSLFLSAHHNVSSVRRSFFSLTMKYTDTNLGGPSTPKHSCVAVPLSCHRTSPLPNTSST